MLTDHGSDEGSRAVLESAVENVTDVAPVSIDARHFMTDGHGRARVEGVRLTLETPGEQDLSPDVLLVYEIPPRERERLRPFLRAVSRSGVARLEVDPDTWRAATDKHRTVERFLRDGIPHMETITLRRPDPDAALVAFERLGRNVWARPTTGLGGKDVFHVTTTDQLDDARRHYCATDQDWLLSRDAGNIDSRGRRHQYRVVVLHDRVLRVVEHVQADPDAPCNEAQGADSTILPAHDLPPQLARLAIAATRALGLPFGGVDLVAENGGVVFEVNVHPVLDVPGGLETVAVPYVEAHHVVRSSTPTGT